MDIIRLNNEIEKFINKNDLSKDAMALKQENAIQSSEEWQRVLDSFAEEGRVLKIGIIGRVKAGKSSMLNALLFDGNDILPKAATPMTAALTIMEYSENVHAEVDFFTQKDIDEIKEKHDNYVQLLDEKISQNERQIKGKFLSKREKVLNMPKGFLNAVSGGELSAYENQEIREKARRQAEREMKNTPLFASYDQYCRIRASGKTLSDLEQYRTISADSVEELMNGVLSQFVGASGPFMPFTKSVTLHIPERGLKGLQIIDTPGINDPVTSRGERTEQLLQDCDVVLIVSPSGQFLSNEDTDLMHRVTTKEGTQQAYIIASQVDNQLFGSESQGLGNPVDVLQRISTNLTNHARNVLVKQVQQYPEMKIAAEKLSSNPVICSSSVAFSMQQRFNEQGTWDVNLKHVWSNLNSKFPDTFASEESAKNALKQLANIEKLHNIIAEVTDNKEKILEQRRVDFKNSKCTAIRNYLSAWEQHISEHIQQIEIADVEELRRQEAQLQRQYATIDIQVSGVYDDLVSDIQLNLNKQLKDKLNSEVRKYYSSSEGARGMITESEEILIEHPWWQFWKNDQYKSRNFDVVTLQVISIRRAIEEIRNNLEDELGHITESYSQAWKKRIYNQIVGALREALGDEELDVTLIARVVRNVLSRIPDASFRLADDIPSSLKKSGQLKGKEAEQYIDIAENYVSGLRDTVRHQISDYILELVGNLKSVNLSKELTGDLESDLRQLLDEIKNKEVSLFRYQSMKTELAELKQFTANLSQI